MRKRVFGSIFLTALVTLLLTTGLLLAAVHAGLTRDMRERLVSESGYLTAVDNIGQELAAFGPIYDDRLTLVAPDGTVLYDNRMDAAAMENHAVRPEIEQAMQNGTGEDSRLSETLSKQTFYYAVRLENGDVLRISATADSAVGALSAASPWIVLIVLLALLVAAVLAGRLTGIFLKPIETLDLHDPLGGEAYDELSPLLHRMDKQNRRIQAQMTELQRRQAEFDDITARMDEGLVLFSGTGTILFANHAARALFPQDKAEGSYLTLCRDAEYIRVVEQALGGEGAHGRLERGGRVYGLTASSVEENSAWHAAVLLIVDITERERAEQQRQEFTANVSHELKTPLTSIMGYAELIASGIAKPEDVAPFAGKIRTEAQRLLALIEDIIRLSQLDEGGEAASFEPVELYALCGTVYDRLLSKAEQRGIALTVSGEAATVSGQRRTLEQMVFNLADNAISYNKPHGSVAITAGTENGAPFVRVSDTGIGIAPADQQRVFERFYRVDKSHSKLTGGTGLGLSIVKHGAALHHAEVELQSQLGEGTTITVRFPTEQCGM